MLPVHNVHYPQHQCFSTQTFHNYMGQRKIQEVATSWHFAFKLRFFLSHFIYSTCIVFILLNHFITIIWLINYCISRNVPPSSSELCQFLLYACLSCLVKPTEHLTLKTLHQHQQVYVLFHHIGRNGGTPTSCSALWHATHTATQPACVPQVP